jgi:hypothetical protein
MVPADPDKGKARPSYPSVMLPILNVTNHRRTSRHAPTWQPTRDRPHTGTHEITRNMRSTDRPPRCVHLRPVTHLHSHTHTHTYMLHAHRAQNNQS